jgi:hypothetical protein
MLPKMSSDIRVFVQWKEPAVFAGDELDCTITFRNSKVLNPLPTPNAALTRSPRSWQIVERSHKTSYSLNSAVTSAPRSRETSFSTRGHEIRPNHKSQRSVSIVSLGGSESGTHSSDVQPKVTGNHPGRHIRAASLQVLPKPGGSSGEGPASGMGGLSSRLHVLILSSFYGYSRHAAPFSFPRQP